MYIRKKSFVSLNVKENKEYTKRIYSKEKNFEEGGAYGPSLERRKKNLPGGPGLRGTIPPWQRHEAEGVKEVLCLGLAFGWPVR